MFIENIVTNLFSPVGTICLSFYAVPTELKMGRKHFSISYLAQVVSIHTQGKSLFMHTIAILSGKGGAGKTTLAVHLGVAAETAGHATAIIDLDPQASALTWKDNRNKETPAVVSAQASRLPQLLQTAEDSGANIVFIDTAPHSEAAGLAAARAAQLVLIPCRPAILDLHAIGSTVEITRLADVPALVVLNAVPARTTLADEARTAIATYNVETAPQQLGQRIAYVHALTAGLTAQEYEPKGKAATEMQALYAYIAKQIGV